MSLSSICGYCSPEKAAVTIQRASRKQKVVKEFQALERAATTTQARVRGHQLRNKQLRNKQLLEAAESGDIYEVEKLLKQGANVNATDAIGNTVLHVAVMNEENLKVVRVLLDKGANVNAKNSDGNTALHVASVTAGFCEDIIEELVIAGAKIDAINNIGKTALDRAIYFGSSHFSRSMKNAIEEGKKKLISLYKNQQLQFEKAVNSPIHECELLREPLLQNAPKNLNETQIQQAIKYRKEKKLGTINFLIKHFGK